MGRSLASAPGGTDDSAACEWLYPGMLLNGRYAVEKELGRGGMGAVYLARDNRVASRLVVIKVLQQKIEESSNGPYLKRKFRQELEALARIKHHGIVGVHDADETPEGRFFLVMEFVVGVTLRAELEAMHQCRSNGMELDRVAYIMRALGQALSAAHKEKVYHRDLKPENIMLHDTGDDEQIKVIDFGIATVKDSQVAANKTLTMVAGTLNYMAPEQLMGKPDAVSDIYALGVIAYEMLTGRVPYNAKTAVQQYELQQTGNMARPCTLRLDLPEAAEAALMTALAFNPRDRQARARDFGDQLAHALTVEPEPKETRVHEPTGHAGALKGPAQYVTRKMTEAQVPFAPQANASVPDRPQGNAADPNPAQAVELAHVLFVDIVGYSKLLTDDQVRVVQQLTDIVVAVPEFGYAEARDGLISLDTGDGMALVFFNDPEAPLRCALGIAVSLKSRPHIQLRMGIHTGTIYRRRGIGAGRNVAGSGINIAQRVMDCGDAGHILLSKTVAEMVGQLSRWASHLHDLGECEVKHGMRVHVFNFYTDAAGNPEVPMRMQTPAPTPDTHEPVVPAPLNGGHVQAVTDRRPVAPPPLVAAPGRVPPEVRPESESHVAPPKEGEPSEPREPQADRILTQILGVSHRQDLRGNEGLIYALAPFGVGEEAPERAFVRIKGQVLQQHIENVRRRVEDLIQRALLKQMHEGSGFEVAATELARHALPECGFVGMMSADIHPQFDIIPDVASQIPWEALEEVYLTCLRCHTFQPPHQAPDTSQPHCGNCGEKMTWAGNKLALAYHLSHLVRGQSWPVAEGKQFLIIQNPTGDLCDPDTEAGRICAQHLDEIQAALVAQGYQINLLKERNATVNHVLHAIKDPSVVGIYYFGHGYFPRAGDEGMLLLADAPLYASQVEEARPKARFVFVNACEGAAAGRDWEIEQRARSVAEAFARGGRGRVVIAPLWPMISVQAAETALAFFRHASPVTPMGLALRHARSESLYRYESGDAHIAWMSYRYFGDPNKTLPVPVETARVAGAEFKAARPGRVFGANGQLDMEAFAFAFDDVLLRAAKRRNLQGRTLLTPTDLVAGLLRKGNLTRFVLRRHGLSADELYRTVCEETETEPGLGESPTPVPLPTFAEERADEEPAPGCPPREQMSEEERRALMAKWIVRDKEQFAPHLVAVLEAADELAQRAEQENEGRQVSEQHVLESLIAGTGWERMQEFGLPPSAAVRQALRERVEEGRVDENGTIRLAGLDEKAQRIIETAHILAQQRGIYPITHRLLLAALLADKNGFAVRVCERAGVRRDLLFALMITASKKKPPRSFGLELEACERIVLPVIEEAKRANPNGDLCTERDLFRAFCERADVGLKELLRLPAIGADLDKLKLFDPEAPVDQPAEGNKTKEVTGTPRVEDLLPLLDKDAERILQRAGHLALAFKVKAIPNRLLLAALLVDMQGVAARFIKRKGVSIDKLHEALLRSVGEGAQVPVLNNDEAAQIARLDPLLLTGVVTDTLMRAHMIAGNKKTITELIFFKAFCEISTLKSSLLRSKFRLDLDALAAEIAVHAPNRGKGGAAEPDPSALILGAPHASPHVNASAGQGGASDMGADKFDERAARVLDEAARLAWRQGWTEIKTPHLFAALIGDGTNAAGAALRALRLNPAVVKKLILSLVRPRRLPDGAPSSVGLSDHARQVIARAAHIAAANGRARLGEEEIVKAFMDDGTGAVGQALRQLGIVNSPTVDSGFDTQPPNNYQSILAQLGNDLTARAQRGELPDIVGRDREIETAMQTLLLTENANPLLVGEAGVGKTAIVEGVAKRIAAGDCPTRLRGARVIEVPAASLVANTPLRGEFEQRVQAMIAAARDNVILFIDEIHTITGGGAGMGLDAGNMLKAALARGEIRLIGATTHAEFNRTIAHDKALSRRFQAQVIMPPTREATIRVLSARQRVLEAHHGVHVTKNAKVAAVDLSGRFIFDRHWPAKARDVLERACIRAGTNRRGRRDGRVTVTARHVAEVVSQQVGIPLARVSVSELSALAALEDRIGKRIVGQDAATRIIADTIRRGRQKLTGADKPWGVFMLVGPPGVGKTELAKVLAEEVYGGDDGLIRFDMGDFGEAHTVARLIGAPPGYIGHDKGSPLVERLRQRPYSLLLFDEIEHAHEDVFAVLLRLFSEGTIIDSDGQTADARNCIIILTSNLLGAELETRRLGFAQTTRAGEATQAELRTQFEKRLPGKFIDRIDAIIRLNPLTLAAMEAIAQLSINELVEQAGALHKVTVEVTPEVARWIAEQAAPDQSSARAVRRIVDEHIAAPLASLLQQAPRVAGTIKITLADGKIRVEWS
jgi:ATP-dependent Clp protease ATP-binding subunit ClpC